MAEDDEQARREQAERLREAVREMGSERRGRPSSPREFTDERAREAAVEERKRLEDTREDDD
jgi:hypothetical protein